MLALIETSRGDELIRPVNLIVDTNESRAILERTQSLRNMARAEFTGEIPSWAEYALIADSRIVELPAVIR
jgi:hypothetical protein